MAAEIWKSGFYFVILWAENSKHTHISMAKYDLNDPGASIHGRTDRRSGDYFRTDKKTGRVYLIHRDRTKKMQSSETQIAARERFATVSKACTAFVKEGKEAVARHEPSALAEAYLTVYAAYNAQKDVTFLRSYVMKFHAAMKDNGKVEIRVDDFVKTY